MSRYLRAPQQMTNSLPISERNIWHQSFTAKILYCKHNIGIGVFLPTYLPTYICAPYLIIGTNQSQPKCFIVRHWSVPGHEVVVDDEVLPDRATPENVEPLIAHPGTAQFVL